MRAFLELIDQFDPIDEIKKEIFEIIGLKNLTLESTAKLGFFSKTNELPPSELPPSLSSAAVGLQK
jgi:hypothetical protein